jgi:hypothetical protein
MYRSTSGTPAIEEKNAQLTMPQSGGWETRTGHGPLADERLKRQAMPMENLNTPMTQRLEKEAATTRWASKWKECPSDMDNQRNRARNQETHVAGDVAIPKRPTISSNHGERTNITSGHGGDGSLSIKGTGRSINHHYIKKNNGIQGEE